MKKSMFVSVILLPLCFALAACGGGRGPSTTIDVTFTEFRFSPDAFVIPAGKEITLNAANHGAVVHEFVIMKFGQTVGDDFGPEDAGNIFWKVELQPGEQVTQTFTAPTEAGDYQVVCGTPGHYMAGMIAKLTVVTQ